MVEGALRRPVLGRTAARDAVEEERLFFDVGKAGRRQIAPFFVNERDDDVFHRGFALFAKDPAFPIKTVGVVVSMVGVDIGRVTAVATPCAFECQALWRRAILDERLKRLSLCRDVLLLPFKGVRMGGEQKRVDVATNVAVRKALSKFDQPSAFAGFAFGFGRTTVSVVWTVGKPTQGVAVGAASIRPSTADFGFEKGVVRRVHNHRYLSEAL